MKALIFLLLLLPVVALSQNKKEDIYEPNKVETPLPENEYYRKGIKDAELNYKPSKSASRTTFLLAIFSPIVALIPAISNTSDDPIILTPQNSNDLKSLDYYTAYNLKARQIRSKKIWGNWITGASINLVASIITYKILTSDNNSYRAPVGGF